MATVPRGRPAGRVEASSDYINQRQSAGARPLPSRSGRLWELEFLSKQRLLPSDGRSEWKIKNLESSPEAWEINPK